MKKEEYKNLEIRIRLLESAVFGQLKTEVVAHPSSFPPSSNFPPATVGTIILFDEQNKPSLYRIST